MRYCKKCVMPDTRPYIKFDKEGVCYPCRAAEKIKRTDWNKRLEELKELAGKYRGMNGDYYDCIIAASGGKDSWYQTYIMKEKLDMNPLLVSVDNYSWTETGKQNWANLKEVFGVDAVVMQMNQNVQRIIDQQSFERHCSANWLFDKAIYAFPAQISVAFQIPLVVYGEDTNYLYGGPHREETPDAKKQFTNDVAKQVSWDEWGIEMKALNVAVEPKSLRKTHPIFLSYYLPWSAYEHAKWAQTRGFRTLDDTKEWYRDGYLTQYEQIDSIGYAMKEWMKFPKFGHQRYTASASIEIREGRMTRKEAVEKVISEDWKYDQRMLRDFLNHIQYKEKSFWDVIDRFANRELVELRDGNWRLKPEIERLLRGGGDQ